MQQTVQRQTRTRARRIVLFNHKGGVGKTTLSVNMALALGKLGRRVLLVDTDPQCNLTGHFLSEELVDRLLDHADSSDGETIWSAVKPIVLEEGDVKIISPWQLRDNVFLLPGDIRLAEFENLLPRLWTDALQRRSAGFRGTTALSALVNSVSHHYNIDTIFYDCGPNIGALNRAIVLDSDFLCIPAACDLFSLRAIKAVGQTLSNWITDWSVLKAVAPSGTYLPPGIPRFIGYIPQRFRTYGNQPARAHAQMIRRIETTVQRDIIGLLRQEHPSLVVEGLPAKLGEVKDFGTLATGAQREGCAIFETTEGIPAQRTQAEDVFRLLAKELLRRARDLGRKA